ncbi:MAG: Flagellar basal-body P-ring formation protein FlgA [uncultured Paraburkholderia sp.]|nr:MAG: Flagellar basal-body P-ring formation protein FlgA [uncultured Paraburkholderia sp.]
MSQSKSSSGARRPFAAALPGAVADAAAAAAAERAYADAAATAQSLTRGSSTRDADAFTRAANASGSIVIAGAGETPAATAAPQMIRTDFKPDANGVVTIPAPGRAGSSATSTPNPANPADTANPANDAGRLNTMPASRRVVPVSVAPAPQENGARGSAGVQPVAANAPSSVAGRAAAGVSGSAAGAGSSPTDGFDPLAARGEPPQFGADGKPVATRASAPANSTMNAGVAPTASMPVTRPTAAAAAVAQRKRHNT